MIKLQWIRKLWTQWKGLLWPSTCSTGEHCMLFVIKISEYNKRIKLLYPLVYHQNYLFWSTQVLTRERKQSLMINISAQYQACKVSGPSQPLETIICVTYVSAVHADGRSSVCIHAVNVMITVTGSSKVSKTVSYHRESRQKGWSAAGGF